MTAQSIPGVRNTRRTPLIAGQPMQGSSTIEPALSVFLDVLRFGAAFTVFVSHASGRWLTGGYLWQIGTWTRAAVIVFFVLSGYVIAATTDPRAGLTKYAVARVSRLCSVALPALALTYLLDTTGQFLFPEFYRTAIEITQGNFNTTDWLGVRYLLTAGFVQESWLFYWLPVRTPGSNQPFWSLSFEAFYYVAFAVILFGPGRLRLFLLFALFIVAGPAILLLWPLWLLGMKLWQLRGRCSQQIGIASFCIGLTALLIFPFLKKPLTYMNTEFAPTILTELFSDYFAGIATGALVFGFSCFAGRYNSHALRFATNTRWVADHTFELYLLHVPLVYFAAAASPFPVGSALRAILVYSVTCGGVLLVARFTPRLRAWIAIALRSQLLRR